MAEFIVGLVIGFMGGAFLGVLIAALIVGGKEE